MFRAGEVVIAAFPFTSLRGDKRRPCVVLAAGDTPNDFVVAFRHNRNGNREYALRHVDFNNPSCLEADWT
jgi:hypothetical protein